MTDNAGIKFILNETIQSAELLQDIEVPKQSVVYEVIRIIEKAPLFFDEHYERLVNSFALLGHKLRISKEDMAARIQKLVEENNQANCNVKIIIYLDGSLENSLIYISKSYYPTAEEYNKGVPVGLLEWERQDPNIKMLNAQYKEIVSRKITENNLFEVLLVSKEKKVTEGSRSNVFFVSKSKVFTAPGQDILKGITRQYVLAACKELDIEIIEKQIDINSLDSLEAVFLSGTSIKVLPVSSIDNRKYDSSVNPTVLAIRERFDRLIEQNLNEYRM